MVQYGPGEHAREVEHDEVPRGEHNGAHEGYGYSGAHCRACDLVKEFLSREGHRFDVKNIEEDDAAYDELISSARGRSR
jgi:hypothetical protein